MQQIQVVRPEDLDAEAAVTIGDVLAAHAAWTRDAPIRYAHLLDAASTPHHAATQQTRPGPA